MELFLSMEELEIWQTLQEAMWLSLGARVTKRARETGLVDVCSNRLDGKAFNITTPKMRNYLKAGSVLCVCVWGDVGRKGVLDRRVRRGERLETNNSLYCSPQ